MTNTKRKTGKILAVLLIAILVCVGTSIFAMTNGALTAYASTYDIDGVSYEKHTAMIEDEFAGDRIIVTLKPKYSGINKSISMQSFKTSSVMTAQCPDAENISRQSIESLSADVANKSESTDLTEKSDRIINKSVIESITDLTQMKNPSKIVKKDSFVQILSIQLRENCKEGVIKAIEELEQLDMVLAAEPDYFIEAQDLWQPPNDTGFNQQWALGATPGIRAQQAWTMTNGTTTPNRVRVGLFETGLDATHPDLRVIAGNMTSGDANHGTHVGGIIGAITHNNQGIAGIAQVELALLDRGNGGALNNTNQGVFPESLVWAIDNDIRIVNCSFRFGLNGAIMRQPIAAHREAIRVFGENGGLLVAAAANDTEDLDAIRQYPAAYGDATAFPEIDNVITVGSIDSNGGLSSFSNWGANSVHIYAPGGNILSTVPRGNTPAGYRRYSDGYAYADGTSMAAPHVAGVAALMLSVNPNLTPQQIRTNIINSGTAVTLTTPDTSFWPWQNNSITFNSRRLDAFAAVSSVANFTYRTVAGGIEITGAPRTLVGSFEIPSQINGQAVVAIGSSAFANQTGMSQISIPASVITIGDSAFANCTSLNEVYIPSRVTSIANYAFYGCSGLSKVIFENGSQLQSIGEGAFNWCSSLSSFTIPDNVSSIESFTFKDCFSLSSITIPNSVTSIGTQAFYNCYSLSAITLPNSVTSIGNSAFIYCTALLDITIPASVTSIDNYAFASCINLKNITIQNGLTSIGSYAFNYCTRLENIVIPDSVTSIGDNAFRDCIRLERVELGYGIVHISDETFYGCEKLSSIILPDGLWSIGTLAFYGCTSLTNIKLGDFISKIDYGAFYNCSSLSGIILPINLTLFGDYVFYGCTSLTTVEYAKPLSTVNAGTFYGCTNLTSILLYANTTNIKTDAFKNCNNLKIIYFNRSDTSPVSFGSGIFPSTPTIHYYSAEQPTTLGFYWKYENNLPALRNITLVACWKSSSLL